ncbi:MAG TPA: ATP-dependent DNA ligase [Agromyces mariniharenae]|nr:ATP-dependent DNA ligase [Agromyces mariniharenae]
MGTLIYNGGISLAVDDRTMAHLQVVIINKLRRRESFTFTWDDGAQQTVCWIAPSIAVEFVYSGNRRPALNRAWLELLALSANANTGLVAVPEPPEPPRPVDRPDERTPGHLPEPISV